MMTIRLQILIIVGVILGLFIFINLVRKEKLELKYILTWLVVLLGILVVGVFPKIIDLFSFVLGIVTPINALFFLGFLFVTCLLFFLTVAISRSSTRTKELTQMVALYQYENKKLQEQINKTREAQYQ